MLARHRRRSWLTYGAAVTVLAAFTAVAMGCTVAEARGRTIEITPELSATATATPTAASPTPVPTVNPPDASPTPVSTPRPFTPFSLQVNSLVCEHFYPGVQDPGGPDHWFKVSGEVTNTSDEPLALQEPVAAQVRVPGGMQGMTVIDVELPSPVLEPGQTYRFSKTNIEAQLPATGTCHVIFIPARQDVVIFLSAGYETEITTFAAP